MSRDVTSPAARLADLMRQGFMKPRRPRRAVKPTPEIVTCHDCQNWHTKGKHTADAATRKVNRAAHKAEEKARAARVAARATEQQPEATDRAAAPNRDPGS